MLNATTGESANYKSASATARVTVNKLTTSITATGVTVTYGTSKNVVITLKSGSSVLDKQKVTLVLNGKTYSGVTNAKGQLSIKTLSTLAAKSYTGVISFAGDNNYIKSSGKVSVMVNKATPKLSASKKTFKVKATKKFSATLSVAPKNSKVTLKVNGKIFSAKTNAKGVVTFKLTNLKKKCSFNAVIKYAGSTNFKAVSKTVKITVKK